MDFAISEEYMMLKESMREFVKREMLPLEREFLERDMSLWTVPGPQLPKEQTARLKKITKELGFWGIEVGEEFGGQGLGMLAKTLVMEELSRSFIGFSPHASCCRPTPPTCITCTAAVRASSAKNTSSPMWRTSSTRPWRPPNRAPAR
ncbi:acyl-CoA dehydrogenase family protein, partial [Desulfosarcina cetonica]|uniref:acyl-CoA dehydrogenase family protein n=1 Tax=Desulfosarcina cetonica TaxID=90730 RepID=UPI000AD85864